jgi:hypothetical protein
MFKFASDSLASVDANVIAPGPSDGGNSTSTFSSMLNDEAAVPDGLSCSEFTVPLAPDDGRAASNSLSGSEFTVPLVLDGEAAVSNSLSNSETTLSSMLNGMAPMPNNLGNSESISALLTTTFPMASALTLSLQINQTPATTYYEPAVGTISSQVPSFFGTPTNSILGKRSADYRTGFEDPPPPKSIGNPWKKRRDL